MANTSSGRMLASQVSEGDTLVLADLASFTRRLVRDQEFTVAKITKTRLVLRPADGLGSDRRVIVRNDEITNRFEGDKRSYVRLFTPDDPQLADLREGSRIDELKSAARNAADRYLHNTGELDRALALRDALNAWIEAEQASRAAADE